MYEGSFRVPRIRAGGAARYVVAVCVAFAVSFSPVAAERGDHFNLYGDYLAGIFAHKRHDNKSAAEFFREAMRQDPENVSILERAFVLDLTTANMKAAEELARHLIKIDTDHHLAHLTLGVAALRGRQYAAARRFFEEDGGKGPVAELTTTLMTSWAYQGAGDLASALKTMKGLDEGAWLTVYRTFNSALMADLSGDVKAAGDLYAEAYRLDDSVLRIADSYARFLARNGEVGEALKVLKAYDEVSKDHPTVTALRSQIEAGRTPSPIVGTTAAGAAESLYEIGALLGREGGEDHAVIYLQLALYLHPDAVMALLTLADVYERQKSFEMAAKTYGRLPASSPLRRSAQIQRAHNLDALGQVEEAKGVLHDLIKADPDDVDPIRSLGDILRGHEQFAEASQMYTKAVNLLHPVDEKDWSLLYYRGICYERTKRWPEAEIDFKHALELKPEQPFVLNYLGYSWVDQGRNLSQAMQMIRKAVELRPEDGYIVDSLGWAHYRLGEYQEAVRELERAIELKPEDPVINDHLGDAYWRAGRLLEARFQWSHARDAKPEPEDLIKIQEKLKKGLPPQENDLVVAEAGSDRLNDAVETAVNKPQAAEPKAEPEPAKDLAKMESGTEATPPTEPEAETEAKPATPQTAAVQSGLMERHHTVMRGETLWSIARDYYGGGAEYGRIFNANRGVIHNRNVIYPGQVLTIPESE